MIPDAQKKPTKSTSHLLGLETLKPGHGDVFFFSASYAQGLICFVLAKLETRARIKPQFIMLPNSPPPSLSPSRQKAGGWCPRSSYEFKPGLSFSADLPRAGERRVAHVIFIPIIKQRSFNAPGDTFESLISLFVAFLRTCRDGAQINAARASLRPLSKCK